MNKAIAEKGKDLRYLLCLYNTRFRNQSVEGESHVVME